MGSKLTRQIREGFDKFYVRAVVILQRSDLFFICEHKLENKIIHDNTSVRCAEYTY